MLPKEAACSQPAPYAGDYADFAQALRFGSNPKRNYQDEDLIQKTLERTLLLQAKARAGQLDDLADAKNLRLLGLLCGLGILSHTGKMPLRVLDFGGAMGNHYFKIRPFLNPKFRLDWKVLDLPRTVQFARRHFQSRELSFSSSLSKCGINRPLFILASGSIHYTSNPLHILQRLQGIAPSWIILDRMPFSPENRSRILLQTVPANVYQAAYPMHLLQKTDVLKIFDHPDWNLQLQWKDEDESILVDGCRIEYQGLAFRKKTRRAGRS